jgi:hypothetical protein
MMHCRVGAPTLAEHQQTSILPPRNRGLSMNWLGIVKELAGFAARGCKFDFEQEF